jgi:diadenosine tetraphosphate (Ap4A) HIT family hydrolase
MKECPFCKIDKEKIIYENKYFYAIFDEFPVSPGHVLVIPKKHCNSILDLKEKEFLSLRSTIKEVIKKIKRKNLKLVYERMLQNPLNKKSKWFCEKVLKNRFLNKMPDGFNIGINEGKAAGQTIDHLHIHIIPRFFGDVKNPIGGIRNIIPKMGNYKIKG